MNSPGRPERKQPSKAGRFLRSFSLITIIALIAVATVVLVGSVIRDRRSLVETRYGTETGTGIGNPGPEATAGQAADQVSSPPFGAIAGTAAPPESANTSEAVFRKASPSVVTVKIYGTEKHLSTQGSGVVVGPGTVATNRHVVESGGEIRVIHQGQAYTATVLYADKEYDLCALMVPGLPAPPADMASAGTIRVGQRVYAIGAPKGLELSISDGLVSAVRAYGTFPLIQTNAPISRGSSGGGLFDTDGRLVGITTASAIEGQNINFALVSDIVSQLPARSADIRTLEPIVPVKRADEITNKALLASLHEGRRAIAASEAEIRAMAGEIERYTVEMREWKKTMDDCLSHNNTRAYNEMVPRYNHLNGERTELANRFERNRQAHAALLEKYNREVERYNARERLQP